jgi:hypothetical protein
MKKLVLFLFLIITLASVFVHYRNYTDLVGFTLDAPIHLTAAKEMVDSGKINLIGPSVTSKETFGRMVFTGPFHYYVLAILGIISNWNVIFISGFYTVLWITTFVILFFWLNKRFGGTIAILLYTLLSFYPFFIQVSRQIWNPQFIPLFGTMFLLCLVERKKIYHYLFAGIFWGLGLNVHYATLLWIFIAIPFIVSEIYQKKFYIKNWLMLILGVIIAELPLIVFELRHNFYNINTILFHLRYGNFSVGYTFNIWYYYVLPFLAPAVLFMGKFLYSIKRRKFFIVPILVLSGLSFYFMLLSFSSQGQKAMHYPGWSIATQKKVVNIIIKDNEEDFEVAETISSDTQAMDIRWWLKQEGVNVMEVDQYKEAPVLYLVSSSDRPPETETVWEVSSLKPFKVITKVELDKDLFLYKIKRI